MSINSKLIKQNKVYLKIDNIIKAKIAAEYYFKGSRGFVDIFNIKYTDSKFGEVFKSSTKGRVYFYQQ